MADLCDLQVHINGPHTFFLNQDTVSRFSGKLRKMIKQEKRRTQIRKTGIEIDGFPGGSDGFEWVLRFCYGGGEADVSAANVCLLHCGGAFLGMHDSLLRRTTEFLDGAFTWPWSDVVACLRTCASGDLFPFADAAGIVDRLVACLLSKIAHTSDSPSRLSLFPSSPSPSSSSPDDRSGGLLRRLSSSSSAKPPWWFDEMTVLPPIIVERFVKTLTTPNNTLILTRFLLHYLKTPSAAFPRSSYTELAETAVHGAVLLGRTAFSCRGAFWVLRIVSTFGVTMESRGGLERLIGGMLDEAKLDDLLVNNNSPKSKSNSTGGVYDVNLVLRLIRVFAGKVEGGDLERMRKVGGLIDKYLREIAPDQNLKVSKFLGVAESLGDSARACFDGVYKAIDIFLESHPSLSLEQRSRICRCLNYEKLTLEVCKDLAKNPRIPPRVAIQALVSQHPNHHNSTRPNKGLMSLHHYTTATTHFSSSDQSQSERNDSQTEEEDEDEDGEVKVNLQRMQWRVIELEKVCREMKGEMSRMVKVSHSSSHAKMSLRRLC